MKGNIEVMKGNIIDLQYILVTHKNKVIIVITILYWVIAILYSTSLGNVLRYPDEQWYFNEYAQNLAHKNIFSRDGVTPTAFHPPLYPLLLGGLVKLGLGITTARLVNFLALFLIWLVLLFWLEKQYGKLTPLLVMFFILGYPVLFYTAGTLYPQTVGSLFFVASIVFYLQEPLKVRHAICGGISTGLAVLTIPTFLYVPLFMVFFSFIFRRAAIRNAALFLVISWILLIPWVIRNYLVFDRFVLLSTNSGLNFLIGNNPSTTPNSGVNVDIQSTKREIEALGLDEFEANEYYIKKSVSYIREDPLRYLSLYFLKALNYFNFRNELFVKSESSIRRDIVMLISYGLLLGLTLIRIILVGRYPLEIHEIFMIILYFCSAFVSAIFFTRIRFRLPYDYLLIVISSIFIGKLLQSFWTKSLSSLTNPPSEF